MQHGHIKPEKAPEPKPETVEDALKRNMAVQAGPISPFQRLVESVQSQIQDATGVRQINEMRGQMMGQEAIAKFSQLMVNMAETRDKIVFDILMRMTPQPSGKPADIMDVTRQMCGKKPGI